MYHRLQKLGVPTEQALKLANQSAEKHTRSLDLSLYPNADSLQVEARLRAVSDAKKFHEQRPDPMEEASRAEEAKQVEEQRAQEDARILAAERLELDKLQAIDKERELLQKQLEEHERKRHEQAKAVLKAKMNRTDSQASLDSRCSDTTPAESPTSLKQQLEARIIEIEKRGLQQEAGTNVGKKPAEAQHLSRCLASIFRRCTSNLHTAPGPEAVWIL